MLEHRQKTVPVVLGTQSMLGSTPSLDDGRGNGRIMSPFGGLDETPWLNPELSNVERVPSSWPQ